MPFAIKIIMKTKQLISLVTIFCLFLPACSQPNEEAHHEHHKILVTCPLVKDVVNTQQYVCQIHSYRHIEIRALESGYLEAIPVKEGQTVKQGDSLFKVVTTLYEARLDAEQAEAKLAEIELVNTERLYNQKMISQPEVLLAQAKLAKAKAKVKLSQAELNFANIKAPFDGIIDHQRHQQGSLISEGDILTTLSDNSTMWVYFNVPESRYLEYQAREDKDNLKVELILANGAKFSQVGKIAAIEADFNNETGNIAFRADFPNPDRLLRHGQTGTILLSRVLKNAVVIPQRATFEILAKKYAFVVEDKPVIVEDKQILEGKESGQHATKDHATHGGKQLATHSAVDNGKEAEARGDMHVGAQEIFHGIVRQREIVILNEMDDIYLIKDGLGVNDRIILEGIRQVRDGDEVEYEYQTPEQALNHLKYHAE